MTLVVAELWPAVAAALAIGLAAGAVAGPPGRLGALAGTALLAGLAVAAFLVPGRAGLWLDGAVPVAAAYLAGLSAGGLARRRLGGPPQA